jgi:putative transposase
VAGEPQAGLSTVYRGRAARILTVLDVYARECVAIGAAPTFSGGEVARVLTAAGTDRGLPWRITVDNGTAFTSKLLDHWAYWHHVGLEFSRPGKPLDNTFIEAFSGTLRRECLSLHWFLNVEDLQQTLATWRHDYNHHRPHSSLANVPLGRVSGRRRVYPGPQRAAIRTGPVDLSRGGLPFAIFSLPIGATSGSRSRGVSL